MRVQSLASVLLAVAARPATNGIRIVGVDGLSGSGKSTLARWLVDLAGAPLIGTDDFASWQDLTGWWPRFDAEVLCPALVGRPAQYRARDWEGDEFGSSLGMVRTVEWGPLVIVEGVACTRAEAGDGIAYRVWVDAPQEVRLARGLARDGESHRGLWARWMRDETAFFAQDRTRARADLVVDGDPNRAHEPERELVILDACTCPTRPALITRGG
jgi:chloramphenicol 3-O-phosphotransferase